MNKEEWKHRAEHYEQVYNKLYLEHKKLNELIECLQLNGAFDEEYPQ